MLPTVVVLDKSNEIHWIDPSIKYNSAHKIEQFLEDIEAGKVKVFYILYFIFYILYFIFYILYFIFYIYYFCLYVYIFLQSETWSYSAYYAKVI